ncbi:cobalamin biosynthesis CobW [Tanacetum coccineum]
MVSVVLAGCSRVVGLAGGFGCGVKCLRSNQNSLLVYLMMVSFLVLVGKIPPDKKRCRRSGGCGRGDESGGSQHDKWIAVIENEFGEVDIDGHGLLVASHSSANEDIVMVNNGCLCCTVRGEPVTMLLVLVKKRRDKFDHIVIETIVVTLVDCKHDMQHLNEVKPRFVEEEEYVIGDISKAGAAVFHNARTRVSDGARVLVCLMQVELRYTNAHIIRYITVTAQL